MIVIRVHKSDESEADEYFSALDCAKSSIESVLGALCSKVVVEGERISICFNDITEAQCKEMIKGCFCDHDGVTYPEFLYVEHLSG